MSDRASRPALDSPSTGRARPLDPTDVALVAALRRDPRQSMAELARTVDIARGTAYSRLDRLEAEGVWFQSNGRIDLRKFRAFSPGT